MHSTSNSSSPRIRLRVQGSPSAPVTNARTHALKHTQTHMHTTFMGPDTTHTHTHTHTRTHARTHTHTTYFTSDVGYVYTVSVCVRACVRVYCLRVVHGCKSPVPRVFFREHVLQKSGTKSAVYVSYSQLLQLMSYMQCNIVIHYVGYPCIFYSDITWAYVIYHYKIYTGKG